MLHMKPISIAPVELQTRLLDAVYEKLCAAIFENEIAAGTRLSVPLLATRFGVSRSPIKEAVQRLVSDGIAESIPRKGVFVLRFELSDIVDLLEITEPLEGMAGRQAAQRVTSAHIAQLESLLAHQQTAIDSGEASAYAKADAQFHRVIVGITGNDRLEYFLRLLQNQIRLVSRLIYLSPSLYEASLTDHKAILRALRLRDPVRAEAAMREHVSKSRERLTKRLAQSKSPVRGVPMSGKA